MGYSEHSRWGTPSTHSGALCAIPRSCRGSHATAALLRERVGHRAAWDPMPGGIPCRVGYHAGWDTMPGVIPCRVEYHAGWDTVPQWDTIPCGAGYLARVEVDDVGRVRIADVEAVDQRLAVAAAMAL